MICIFVSLLLVLSPIWSLCEDLTHIDVIYKSDLKTWKEAQSACRENYMDLITVRDNKFEQFFATIPGAAWIGLYRENNDSPWKWSRGNETANYITWNPNEPQDNEHCAMKWLNTVKWINIDCNYKSGYVCSDEKLILVKENKTWEESLEHCRSLRGTKRYDLTTLVTDNDHVFARFLMQQADTDEVWTGLRYLGDEWMWVGGEQVNYKNIPICPAFRCGVLVKNTNEPFGMRDCSKKINFFCYKKT